MLLLSDYMQIYTPASYLQIDLVYVNRAINIDFLLIYISRKIVIKLKYLTGKLKKDRIFENILSQCHVISCACALHEYSYY